MGDNPLTHYVHQKEDINPVFNENNKNTTLHLIKRECSRTKEQWITNTSGKEPGGPRKRQPDNPLLAVASLLKIILSSLPNPVRKLLSLSPF